MKTLSRGEPKSYTNVRQKIDFKDKNITKEKEGHLIVIKWSMYRENIF